MQVFVLLSALSIDLFIASVAFGMEHIEVKPSVAACISVVCSSVLAFSLVAGTLLNGFINDRYTKMLGFIGLFTIGLVKLVEYAIKAYIKKHRYIYKNIRISFSQLSLILSIYNNPLVADKDHSLTMSVTESVFFAFAMSLDGLFGGIGAAFLQISIPMTVLLNLIISFLIILGGVRIGWKASNIWKKDFGWIGGALFLVLALSKVLG